MTKAILLAELRKLNSLKQYNKVLKICNDLQIRAIKQSDILVERSITYRMLGQHDLAYQDAVNAIILDKMNERAYTARGDYYDATQKYQNAINDYSYAIMIKPDYGDAFYKRACSNKSIGNYKEAFVDFNIAIILNKKDDFAYYGRAILHYEVGNYDKAELDLKTAINLNPKFSEAYIGLGNLNRKQGRLKEALALFKESCKINPTESLLFMNRALVYKDMGKSKYALADCIQAIKLDKTNHLIYVNRGFLYYELKKYNEAINDFLLAIELNPNALKQIPLSRIILHLRNITIKQKTYLFAKSIEIDEIVWRIKSFLSKNIPDEVVHYTNLKAVNNIVSNSGKFRTYNVSYLNDPTEGHIIFNCFQTPSLKHIYNESSANKPEDIYIGSFVSNINEDELVMWRTYGKNEKNEEASGGSIVIGRDFFDRYKQYIQPELEYIPKANLTKKSHQMLYRVIYYDIETQSFTDPFSNEIGEEFRKLNKLLEELLYSIKNTSDKSYNNAVYKVIYYFISELKYLVKSSDYSFEKELRVLQYPTYEKPLIDEASDLPKKLYIESNRDLLPYLKKIILGPKVPNHTEWKLYLKARLEPKFSVEVLSSNKKFK